MTAVRRVLVAVLATLALVAASCGSDDLGVDAGEATATTAATATTEGADDATATTEDADGDTPVTGIDVIQKLALAMREDDRALLEEVGGGDDRWFIEWQIALRAEPEFTECTESSSMVSCTVAYGDDFFYTQITGEPQQSTIAGTVVEDRFVGSSFPAPAGVTAAEAELRLWVQEEHPELEGDLYGTPSYTADIMMTRESGELRMELLDEYLEWRDRASTALGEPETWTWVSLVGAEVGLPEEGQDFWVSSMTHGEGLFVMVGYRQRDAGADGFVEGPVIWTSADGGSWSAADVAAAESGEGLYAVAYGSGGFVAVGEVGGDAIGAPPVGAGVVWTSPSGSEWTRQVPDEWQSFVPRAVASAGDGAYVAVGATDRFRASVWRSADGVSWSEVAVFEDSEFIGLEDVVAGPSGMVAVGSRLGGDDSRGFVVHSSDGLSWTDVSLDETVFPSSTSISQVEVAGDGGFVAAGSDLGSETRAAVWTSPDGVIWERWPVESAGSYAYVVDMATLPDTGITLVSGVLAEVDQAWIESGALWRVATVDGSTNLEPLAGSEDISLGISVQRLAASDIRLVALGREGEPGSVEIVVWTASPQ